MTLTSVLSADAEAALIALISEHHEQADQALERPLADWSQWLDAEGYGANDLDPFFLNPDLLQHWQGEAALTDLYAKAIAAGQSTGQFIDALKDLEPAYLEHTVEAADLLLAKSAELMATAGGTGQRTTGEKLKIAGYSIGGAIGGVVLGIGAYKGGKWVYNSLFKKSDAVNPDSIAKDATQIAEKSLENQAKNVLSGKTKFEVAQELVERDLRFQANKFSHVVARIENDARAGLDDYERNHNILIETMEKIDHGKLQIKKAFKEEREQAIKEQKNELKDLQDHPDKIFKSEYNLEFQNSEYGKELSRLADAYKPDFYLGAESRAMDKAKKLHGPDLVKAFTNEKMQQFDDNIDSMMSDLEADLDSAFKESFENIKSLIEKNAQNKIAAEIKYQTGIFIDTAENDMIKTAKVAAKDAEEDLVADAKSGFENKIENIEEDAEDDLI
jgi:hypothetical protein